MTGVRRMVSRVGSGTRSWSGVERAWSAFAAESPRWALGRRGTASGASLGSGADFDAWTRGRDEPPSEAYARLVAEGKIRDDPAQMDAIKTLDVVRALARQRSGSTATTTAGGRGDGGWSFGGWFAGGESSAVVDVAPGEGGAYVHGGPGSGKTFVMDLFFATLPGTSGKEKRREHFHSFMLDTHRALHALKDTGKNVDTVGEYASNLAAEMQVLCLDEFQIVDVADAMIIRRLLEALWAKGVLVVTTSNRHPDELYKNGLNRAQFLPCIAQIKERCVVHEMKSDRDYRLTGSAKSGEENITWLSHGTDAEREEWLAKRLKALAGERSFKPLQIAIGGRLVHVRRAGGGIAHFDFRELCDSALGAADYTALASIFNTVGVGHVPTLSADRLDLVRRFITFIDIMYEHKVKLLVSADALPHDLYHTSSGAGGSRKDAARDEEFAWDRAVSRLAEMQTTEFQEAMWNPKAGSWLLEQARVTEVVPPQVLRSIWQRYDRNRDNVLDETELECLIGDLNQMRSGHRHVSEEQLDAVMSIVRGSNVRSNRYITYAEFERYGNEAFLECMRDR